MTATPSTAGTELLACPCCKAVASHAAEDGVWHLVRCTNRMCGIQSGIFPTKPMAFRVWNTRTPPGLSREAWQPIETAPKDGSNALVFDIDVGAVVAYWLNNGWLLVGGKFGAYPTHWRPLPNPPEPTP